MVSSPVIIILDEQLAKWEFISPLSYSTVMIIVYTSLVSEPTLPHNSARILGEEIG